MSGIFSNLNCKIMSQMNISLGVHVDNGLIFVIIYVRSKKITITSSYLTLAYEISVALKGCLISSCFVPELKS